MHDVIQRGSADNFRKHRMYCSNKINPHFSLTICNLLIISFLL